MTSPTSAFRRRGRFGSLLSFFGVAVIAAALTCDGRAAAVTAHIDLPADSAEKSLKRFSEQTGREVLFASEQKRKICSSRRLVVAIVSHA